MPNFTDSFIKGLQPKVNRYFIRDPNNEGFGIRVMSSGTKVFYLVYKTGGSNKQQWLRLGAYPEMSLADARQEYRKMKTIQDSGQDPATVLRDQKQERRTEWTIDKLCDEFLEKYSRIKKRARSAKEDELNLARDVRKLWGKRKVREIRRGDVVSLLDEIVNRGAGVQANRTQATISKMFAWALEREIVELNPANGVSKRTIEIPKERDLKDDELVELWKALGPESKLPTPICNALKIILLTGVRPGEAINAQRSQLDGDWLDLPSTSTKTYKRHFIYLSKLAKQSVDLSEGDHLISRKGIDRLEVYTLSSWVRRKGFLGLDPWTPHDLRRTCVTNLAALRTPTHIVDRVINHAPTSVRGRVYDKYLYRDEIQQALDKWANKVDQLVNPQPPQRGKVIQINR